MIRLLLDEDIKAKSLVKLLVEAGHDVLTTSDLSLDGHSDAEVLAAASADGRVVLTYNCDDFRVLHNENTSHCGIILAYQEPGKSLSYGQIVLSLGNLEKSGSLLPGTLHVLNHWCY